MSQYCLPITIAVLLLWIAPRSAGADDAPWSADPKLVEKLANRRPFNYDESRVPQYKLPDPLAGDDGSRITSPEDWNSKRRPELMELFRREVYGRRPEVAHQVSFHIVRQIENAFEGKAHGQEVRVEIRIDDRMYAFSFVAFLPTGASVERKNSVPVIVHINNRYQIPLEKAVKEDDPFWPARTIVEAGFATASFHTSDVDPDSKNGYAKGIRAFFADGDPPADDAWRSLSAWGWAASRILDYLQSTDQVDISRSAVVGHSRGGKTSLWAACEDQRFAIAYSNDSGCGGAALSRRRFGETVERITTSFPHWFSKNFSKYAGKEDTLPVDQHEVIALVAPRGVYVASADEDLWADPRGEYSSLIAAAPVFRLHGKRSIVKPEMPALDSPRHVGATGYHIRRGKHNLTLQDWQYFLNFAKQQFGL